MAALSSQTSGLPWTCWCRTGKSRRIAATSNGAGPSADGDGARQNSRRLGSLVATPAQRAGSRRRENCAAADSLDEGPQTVGRRAAGGARRGRGAGAQPRPSPAGDEAPSAGESAAAVAAGNSAGHRRQRAPVRLRLRDDACRRNLVVQTGGDLGNQIGRDFVHRSGLSSCEPLAGAVRACEQRSARRISKLAARMTSHRSRLTYRTATWPSLPMLVVVVVADFDVFQDAQGVVGQHGTGEVERQEVRGHAQAVEPHQAGGEAGHDLARDAGLVQTDDALVGLADPQQQDARRADHWFDW